MLIGPVDIATSNKLAKRANRRESLHSPGISRVNEKITFSDEHSDKNNSTDAETSEAEEIE